MYYLVERCYQMREPVLLVGETGGGKTTVCQLLSTMLGSKLHILNCHQYTETSDFLGVRPFIFISVSLCFLSFPFSHGLLPVILLSLYNFVQFCFTIDQGFYPVRERSSISLDFQNLCEKLAQSKAFIHFPGDAVCLSLTSMLIFHLSCHHLIRYIWFLQKISVDINQASQTLNVLSLIMKSYKEHTVSNPEVTADELKNIENIKEEMYQLLEKWRTIFKWQDGPLVEAMKSGDLFLVDEISLADDSVLERLNSVLEPERKLVRNLSLCFSLSII